MLIPIFPILLELLCKIKLIKKYIPHHLRSTCIFYIIMTKAKIDITAKDQQLTL